MSKISLSRAALLVAVCILIAPAYPEIGYWTFDNAGTEIVVDESGNGNHGDLVNNPDYIQGVVATGLELDGRTQHMMVTAGAAWHDLDRFTLAAWILPEGGGFQAIFSKDAKKLSLALAGADPYLKGCVKVGPLVCSKGFKGSIVSGRWQFVAMTYTDEGDRTVRLYIDGKEVDYKKRGVASDNRIINYDRTTPLAVGALSTNGKKAFGGRIDEVRVFDVALDDNQILELYQQDLSRAEEDTFPPTVTISDPASDDIQTTESVIDLAGIAADESGVVDVTWSSDRGQFGAAVGTTSWTATAIPLEYGVNHITVSALDPEGNAGTASRSVLYAAESASEFEGYGANTTGGSEFPIYVAESAAEFSALLQSISELGGGARIKLAGNWSYSSNVLLNNLSNVTLDGTGSSVTLENSSVIVKCSENIVVQGIRIRNDQTGDDAIQVNSSKRVVIDHNSISGAGDGNIDVTGWSCGASSNITVSWNIFADTWKQSLVRYGETSHVSFHHNLFYNNGNRLPSLSAGEFDIRNNVFWQWGSSGTALNHGAKANIVGNFYEVGNSEDRGHAAIWYVDDLSEAWIQDNVLPSAETDVSRLSQPLATPPTTTHDPSLARQLVVDQAGAWPRDSYDSMLIDRLDNRDFPPPPPFHD